MNTKIEIIVKINDNETNMGTSLQTTETIPESALPYTIKCLGMQYFSADVGCFARKQLDPATVTGSLSQEEAKTTNT